MTRRGVLLVALAACSRKAPGEEPPVRAPVEADAAVAAPSEIGPCERLPFAETVPVPEASGAQWLARDGGVIMVVGDSGHHGAYAIISADDGEVLEDGKLPLGGPGDDLEGLAAEDADGARMWAISSSGWMRGWRRTAGGGYELDVPAHRIDEDDECAVASVNCGHNYEGLCLATRPLADGCHGYAVAKTDGELVCLVRDGERWAADRARSIDLGTRDATAACDLTPDGAVWTGDNLFGGTTVRKLVGGKVVATAILGVGFPEAMAIAPGGLVYRFSDLSGHAPSRVAKYRCAGGGG